MTELAVRAMGTSKEDLRLFRDCFNRNGSQRTDARLVWQYVENPTGTVYVDLAVAGNRVASIYASLPVRMRINGAVRLAIQSLDTLTDVEYRGQGLFVRLARSLFARATDERVALVYGFPNGNSAHGFFKRLEWIPLDPVPFLIRPLRSRYVIKRLKLEARAPRLASVTAALPDVRLPVAPPLVRGIAAGAIKG